MATNPRGYFIVRYRQAESEDQAVAIRKQTTSPSHH